MCRSFNCAALQKHILVLADPVAVEKPLQFHDLHVMAQYMAKAGFQVTEADSQPYHYRDRDDEALWRGLLVGTLLSNHV